MVCKASVATYPAGLLLLYHISIYVIAKSAIDPAPQGVTRKSEVGQILGCLWHAVKSDDNKLVLVGLQIHSV